jgi:hypothetical protein
MRMTIMKENLLVGMNLMKGEMEMEGRKMKLAHLSGLLRSQRQRQSETGPFSFRS